MSVSSKAPEKIGNIKKINKANPTIINIILFFPNKSGKANSIPVHAFLEVVKNIEKPMDNKKHNETPFLRKSLDFSKMKAILNGKTKLNHEPV